ncbi:P-loop containing nucleoside triphosphate hydrolase protein [Choiromyces venosus 120613-1]|uniref:P-loop containing nucleoside triphosphate hydrolase protein n=1 Tax=Choiromyces venosus 120613-1 TaxID=1336337 RepID=A0A3N4JUK3_9PEZI|nr:P-loop containing nucleoside triphosphate hydrolase protein [Choiromyces venosus 120613-1]
MASFPDANRPLSRRRSHHSIDITSLNPNTTTNPSTTLDPEPPAIPVLEQLLGLKLKTSYFSLYRPLNTWRQQTILALAIILSLAAGAPLPIIGVIFGKIINHFPPTEDELQTRIGQLLGVAVAYFFITWGWVICWGIVGERVSRGLREDLLKKAVGMDIAYFEVECPDIANRLTADTQTIQLGTSEKAGLFLQSVAYFIAAFMAGFILNARLTGILFAAVVPAMFVVITFGSKVVSKYAGQATEYSEKATSVAEGAITAVQAVQAFDALDKLADEHLKFVRPAIIKGAKKAFAGALMLGLVYFVAYSANALAFWQGSQQIAEGLFKGDDGAGTVYTVVFLILDASFVIGSFGPFLQTFALAAAAGEKTISMLDRPDPVINVCSTQELSMPEPVEQNDIVLDNVTFIYPARPSVKIVEDINLTFEAGKATAIVGPSGSGKSTIAAMLMRFYDPASGRVIVGNHDLRELNIRDYRRHVALVDQEPVLFSGTIMENIRHGLLHKEGLSENEVTELCYQAASDTNAYEFIASLPDGFNTKLGGAGATQLSGGQRQRVSLARALVSDPSILLLDEPTSALDAQTEAVVLEALDKAKSKKGRTTIMIAHRLATVHGADKIVVIQNGHVVEEGTHESLVEAHGAYHALVKSQRLLGANSSASSLYSAKTKVEDDARLIERVGEKSDEQEQKLETPPIEKSQVLSSGALIRRCLSLSKPDAPIILIGLIASIITGGIILGEAVIFGNLISTLNNQRNSAELKSRAVLFSLIFFVLALIALAAYTTSGSAFGIVSERLIRRIRDISLRNILRQDIAWFQTPAHSPAALISMLNMDTGHLSGLFGVILSTIFSVTTSMVGGVILAHVVAWKIAIVLLAAVPIMLVSGFLRLRVLAKFQQRHEMAYVEAAALATEACTAIKTVAALGRESDVTRLYGEAVDKPYRESLRFIVTGNFWLAFALAITYFVYALAYYWGSRQVRDGNYIQLDFFFVLPALLFSAQASSQMFSLAPEVTRAKSAALSVFKIHDQKPAIDIDSQPSPGDKSAAVGSKADNRSKVEFRGVQFRYATRPDAPVLDGMSCTIKPGQFVAFVGYSGIGKSSAVALLERFYDVSSGSILVDDVDIRSIPVRDHRSRISLVSQEPCLFPGSIHFNVSLGAVSGKDVSRKDVERTCKMCGLHDFIMSLPEGYETDCGTNGSQLSGGQKQRVSLARALMRDPAILLLDEATSALDSHSEKLIQEAVAKASRGRTCISVAHRLASIQMADCIYVFEKGKIVEQGRHHELVARDGIYASMSKQQSLE